MIDSLSDPENDGSQPAADRAGLAPADLAELDIAVGDARWAHWGDVRARLSDAFRATLAAAGPKHIGGVAISVLLTNDAKMRRLNDQHRGRNAATNVLSFPLTAGQQDLACQSSAPDTPFLLGDIALSLETIAREAKEGGLPVERHLTHLAVHGLLHLLGHDHMREEEADAMERLEVRILETLGIPNPYALEPHARTTNAVNESLEDCDPLNRT